MKNEHLTPRDAVLTAGEPAPDFTLLDQDRNEWKLSDALEKGDVVLSFYPMSFTGVCGTEMECITKEMARWQDQGAQIVGVSCDSFAVQKAWADQGGFTRSRCSPTCTARCARRTGCTGRTSTSRAGGRWWSRRATGPEVKWSQGREVMNAMDFDEVLAAMG
jgi:peroxiredoxin